MIDQFSFVGYVYLDKKTSFFAGNPEVIAQYICDSY